MKNEKSASCECEMSRRDFLKAGAACAGAVICGVLGKSLLLADDGTGNSKGVKFKIVRGNKCKRCPKVLQDALSDREFRQELSKCFKGGMVYIAYGGRAKIKPEDTTIAFGRCARNLDATIKITTGCPPKKEQLLAAAKSAMSKKAD